MRYKKFINIWLMTVFFPLAVVFSFNYAIDPLWCFSHANSFNQHQPAFNERQQKTNRLYFTGATQYDTLLLGSSRTAYINQHDFRKFKVFNYAVNVMSPWEYHGWIENAKAIKGKSFDVIIIGMDFFGTAKNLEQKWKKEFDDPSLYLKRCKEPFYRYKSLISYDALKYSIKSIQRTYHPTISDFDRQNVRKTIFIDGIEKSHRIKSSINEYRKSLLDNYSYNENFLSYMKKIKSSNPSTKFIIFTTPVSEEWFNIFILNSPHIDAYKRWLREMVNVFDEVYHFMYINSFTKNLDNFFDAHHIYPESAKLIISTLENRNHKNTSSDFVIMLNKKNIENYLDNFQSKKQTKEAIHRFIDKH